MYPLKGSLPALGVHGSPLRRPWATTLWRQLAEDKKAEQSTTVVVAVKSQAIVTTWANRRDKGAGSSFCSASATQAGLARSPACNSRRVPSRATLWSGQQLLQGLTYLYHDCRLFVEPRTAGTRGVLRVNLFRVCDGPPDGDECVPKPPALCQFLSLTIEPLNVL